jgi:hypothetical protein
MKKTYIRSYSINAAGDIQVWAFGSGDHRDLSSHYENAQHAPRNELRPECYVDVFRYDDGGLAWSGSPNGHDVPSAKTYQLLLNLVLEDVDAADGSPRAF